MNRNRKWASDRRTGGLLACTGLAVAICFLICLAGVAGAAEKEVKFASLNPVTGPLATFGITLIHGVDMAVEEINAAGGIKSLGGAKLKLIRYDTESKPEMGVTSTERAINDGVVAILGTTGSSIALPATTAAERNGVPMIVPEAVHPQITARGYKYIFRICPMQDSITRADVETIVALRDKKTGKKIKTIGVMHEDGAYGQETAKTIRDTLKPYGIDVVEMLSYPKGVSDVSSLLLKFKEKNVDLVHCTTYFDDAVLITKQLEELKYMPMGVYITGGTLFDSYIRATGKLGNYIFGDRQWSPHMKIEGVPKGRIEKLNAKWKSAYNNEDMDGMAMLGFSAVYVLKDALERAASTDRDKIRDALAKTNYYGGIQPCKGGRIQFDETGQNRNALFFGVQFLKGRAEIIWPAEYATAQPVFPVPKWADRK